MAAIIGGSAWWMRGPREPIYQGHRLSDWLSTKRFPDDLQSNSYYIPDDGPELTSAFQVLGPDAVKWLAWSAEHGQNPPVIDPLGGLPPETEVRKLWRKLFHRHIDEYYDERMIALKALRVIGPGAAAAIPAVLPLLADSNQDHVEEAASVLVGIGPRAKSAIAHGYQEGSARTRYWILAEIYRWTDPSLVPFQGHETDAVPVPLEDGDLIWLIDLFVKACSDPDATVRYEGASGLRTAFARCGQRPALQPLMPGLIDLLASPDPGVCEGAAYALRFFGPRAASAIPRLIELLDHPSADLCKSVVQTLSQIDRTEKRSIPRLMELAKDPDWHVSSEAAEALESFDHPPEIR